MAEQNSGTDWGGLFINAFAAVGISWMQSKFASKSQRTPSKPNTLSDFDLPTAMETRPVPDVVGTVRVTAPNTLWAGDFHTAAVMKTERTGLFSKTSYQVGNNYGMGLALGLCLGAPGLKLRSVLVDDTHVAWAGTLTSGGTANIVVSYGDGDLKSGVKCILEFHCCDTTPSAYLERQLGVGQVPAYSHLCYVVLRGPDGAAMNGQFGAAAPNGWVGSSGSLPTLTFELEHTDVLPSAWVPAADVSNYVAWRNVPGAVLDGDANPAYVLYRIERHQLIGAGTPAELIDWASFHAAAHVLHGEGNGWSNCWDSARTVNEYRQEIEQQINGAVVADPITGMLQLRLIRETEAVVLAMTPSNIATLTSFSRTSQDDAVNEISLAYTDRDAGYISRTALAHDLGAIAQAGQVNSQSVSFSGVSNQANASTLTVREVRAQSAPLARVSATVNTTDRTLRNGDVVSFTWPELGITGLRMRLTSVQYRDLYSGQVDIDAVEDVFLTGVAAFAASIPPVGGGSSESNTPPASAPGRAYIIQAPWGLAQTDYDRPMLLVSPSDASQKTFEVAYNATNTSALNLTTAQWDGGGPYPLMVSGDLSAALTDVGTTVSVTLNAVNGAMLKTFSTTGGLLALVGNPAAYSLDGTQVYEFVKVSAFSVSSDGLTASLTLSKRGIYDTYPGRWAAGAQVWVIPQAVLDPSGLAACMSPDVLNGPVASLNAGESFSRPFIFMRNAAGLRSNVSAMVGSTSDGIAQDGTSSRYASRAPRPVNAGQPKLDGTTGAYSRLDTLPTVSSSWPKTISWVNRWKGSDVDQETAWATGTGIVIPNTIGTQIAIQRLNSTGTAWTTLTAQNITSGAQSWSTSALTTSLPNLVSGDILRVVVSHYTNVGTATIMPFNVTPGDTSDLNNPRARHYKVL